MLKVRVRSLVCSFLFLGLLSTAGSVFAGGGGRYCFGDGNSDDLHKIFSKSVNGQGLGLKIDPLPEDFKAGPMDLVSPNGRWMLSANTTQSTSNLIFFKMPEGETDFTKAKPFRFTYKGELLARNTSPNGKQIFFVVREKQGSIGVYSLDTQATKPKPVKIFAGAVENQTGDILEPISARTDLFEMGIHSSDKGEVTLLLQDFQKTVYKFVINNGETKLVPLRGSNLIQSQDGKKIVLRHLSGNDLDLSDDVLVIRIASLEGTGGSKKLTLKLGTNLTNQQSKTISEGQILIPNIADQIVINSKAGIFVFDSKNGNLLKLVNEGWARSDHSQVQISEYGQTVYRGIKGEGVAEVIDLIYQKVVGQMAFSDRAYLDPLNAYAVTDLGPANQAIQMLDIANVNLYKFDLSQSVPDYGHLNSFHVARDGSVAFIGYIKKAEAGKPEGRQGSFALRFP